MTTQPSDQNSGYRDMEYHDFMHEVRENQLEIVRLTSVHSMHSGSQLHERGWMLHYSGFGQSKKWPAGLGLLMSLLNSHVLEFTLK